MGEFHDGVTKLLGVFSCGILMIKAQRRKNEQLPLNSASKKAETHLSKSLRKNRLEVENAYGEDLVRYGPSFANGDAEAHSSLSKILFRLNAVIKRFTTGKTTNTDYQALLNLSNASRIDAINTFERLSQRLSRSSLALVPLTPAMKDKEGRQHQHQRRKKSSTSSSAKHSRSKSTPELSVTTQGWVRPKAGRKQSSDSTKSSSSSTSKRATRKIPAASTASPTVNTSRPRQAQIASVPHAEDNPQITPPPQYTTFPVESLRTPRRTENRKSFMSFASDSTKIGEIPEHKWAQTASMKAGKYPMTTYYPAEPYQEPEKQRSRLMKLFRR